MIILLVCLGACAPKQTSYSDFKDISSSGWVKNEPFYFTPQYPDSTQSYDLYISIRHDNYYSYRNLWTFVDYVDSNNKIYSDTVNFLLADEYGNWHSKGFGSLYQYEIKTRSAVKPNDISRIIVWQGMRDDTIKQITNIGITLKPIQ